MANQFTRPLTYISLFSCAGVGCYGFKMNGFECVATNELIDTRLNVQRANHKCKRDSGYIGGDITLSETQEKLFTEIEHWKKNEGIESIDVVVATPPCQGMSTANYKKSDTEQVRNSLVVEAIKIIKNIRPKVFILENVRAFLKTICTDVDGHDKPISESILGNLSKDYNISWRIINFKDYGVPSSRPRTLVIGTLRVLKDLSPLLLFPSRHKEITLREVIGGFSHLEYGEKDKMDPFHFARIYPKEQLKWIENITEGQSAFDQDIEFQPGRIDENGNKIVNKGAYMGNKYRRLTWDKVCSCIHTRNDVMSSQDTLHPVDNRVLSIRELMRVMSIPDSFQWTPYDDELTIENSDDYLKQNELNIRRCIGEAVPTQIMNDISSKIQRFLLAKHIDSVASVSEVYDALNTIDVINKEAVDILVSDDNVSNTTLVQIISLFSEKNKIRIWFSKKNSVNEIDIPFNVEIKQDLFKGVPDYILKEEHLIRYPIETQLSLF